MRSTSKPDEEVRQRSSTGQLPGISIVVPVFDEEGTLEEVLERTLEVAARIARQWQVIVVDDGSRDRSPQIAGRFADAGRVTLLTHHQNRGFGAAQRTGFAACRQPFVTLVPADGQLEPAELGKLVRVMNDTHDPLDIVVGVRSDRPDGVYRRVKTWALKWTMKHLFELEVSDVNWVKLYRRAALERLQLQANGIGLESEILVKAQRLGLAIAEVELGYLRRRSGVAKGDRVGSVLTTLWELLQLRLGRL